MAFSKTTVLTFFALLVLLKPALIYADEALKAEGPVSVSQIDRLRSLGENLSKKTRDRDELWRFIKNGGPEEYPQERARIAQLDEDIEQLDATLELMVFGNIDTSSLSEDDSEFDWNKEISLIAEPIIDSLKSITERPRKISELRDSIDLSEQKLESIRLALLSMDRYDDVELDANTRQLIDRLRTQWADTRVSINEELTAQRARLEHIEANEDTVIDGFWSSMRGFVLGRGLTLLITLFAAIAAWLFMRVFWWFFSRRILNKTIRRQSTWYRLISYSYYLLSAIVVVSVVIIVLYLREDILLLALAIFLIAFIGLGMRRYLPQFYNEARLLLNLGTVREEECVVVNGLPWQVMSLNINTVLRNPSIDGIIRLPLSKISELESRPIKNQQWFPSKRDDYVLLADGTFGQVKSQSPDLVRVEVKGGMSRSIPTVDYFNQQVTNISEGETFGIAIEFGLDYEFQALALDEVPKVLQETVSAQLVDAGYEKQMELVICELKSAGASSLDFVIFAKFDTSVACDYFSLERLMHQACVAASNARNWGIPFPQVVVHDGSKI